MAVITLVGTIASGIIAVFMAKVNAQSGATLANSDKTLANSEATKDSAAATSETVDRIHHSVNSEREAMLAEIKSLRELIKHDAETIAMLVERAKLRDHPDTKP